MSRAESAQVSGLEVLRPDPAHAVMNPELTCSRARGARIGRLEDEGEQGMSASPWSLLVNGAP